MQARSRMTPTKENLKLSFQNTNMDCRACFKEMETQQHLMDCGALMKTQYPQECRKIMKTYSR